jgi:carbonic anhydrase
MRRTLRVLAYLAVVTLLVCSAVGQNQSTVSVDQIWSDLAAGNHRFVVGKTTSRNVVAQRQALAKSQHPRVTVLSCSDKKPEIRDLAVRDHIHRVAEELLAKSTLMKEAVEKGKVTIIEAYYSLDTGEVAKLR